MEDEDACIKAAKEVTKMVPGVPRHSLLPDGAMCINSDGTVLFFRRGKQVDE